MEIDFCRTAVRWLVLSLCSWCVSMRVFAQTDCFYGKWVLKERTSLSGVDFENGLPKKIGIAQKEDSLNIERLNTDASGNDYIIQESMSLNGIPATVPRPGNRKRTSAIKLSHDHSSLTETVNYY